MKAGGGQFQVSNKLGWVEIYGAPLMAWSKAFFKKLGGLVREMLWIDIDT